MKKFVSPHYSKVPESLALAGILALAPAASAQNLSVYVSKPGDRTAESSLPGTAFATENFNNIATGDVADGQMSFPSPTAGNGGTYTVTNFGSGENRGAVSVDGETYTNGSQPGGYGGFNQENYLAVNGTGSTVDITFGVGQSYFGFYWSAGDSSNIVSFYDDQNNVLGIYSTDSLIQLLGSSSSGGELTAMDGSEYPIADYYGQTGPGTFNATEPYGYLHFIDPTSSGNIHRVSMTRQTPADGAPDGYFESDNHSVAALAPDTTNTTLVPIGTVSVPEPSTSILAMVAGLGLMIRRRRA